MILIDTSVWIEAERKRVQAMARVGELLESGEAAVSVVTVFELLRSPSLPPAWRAFYTDLFSVLPVLDVDRPAAEGATILWGTRQGDASKDAADALIAGTAAATGCALVTCDAAQAALAPGSELLRPS